MDPLLDAGLLPALSSVLADAATGSLECVSALPNFPCYCPPVWTSIVTGRPASEHRILNLETPSTTRGVKAIWTLLAEHHGTSSLLSTRGTWPPEPEARLVLTEPGADAIGLQLYDPSPPPTHTGIAEPATWTKPIDLMDQLALVPADTPDTSAPLHTIRDRVATAALLEMTNLFGTSNLTVLTVHQPDKTAHLLWETVQDHPDEPLKEDVILAGGAAWTEPGWGIWSFGTVASPYLEVDSWLGLHLAQVSYDYVMLVSDHGMSRNLGEGFSGIHGPPAPQAHTTIFSISGPGINSGAVVSGSVLDVAPTLAYILEIPVADDLPGRVLSEAFTEAYLSQNEIDTQPTWE